MTRTSRTSSRLKKLQGNIKQEKHSSTLTKAVAEHTHQPHNEVELRRHPPQGCKIPLGEANHDHYDHS